MYTIDLEARPATRVRERSGTWTSPAGIEPFGAPKGEDGGNRAHFEERSRIILYFDGPMYYSKRTM